jgi:hypothetical protein
MIDPRPYSDDAALAVLNRLDPSDHLEAEIVRGTAASGYAIWADWRASQGIRVDSRVFFTGPERGAVPFAVGCLTHTGQAGVAGAAFLARDHRAFRRPIAVAAQMIRQHLPGLCAEMGVHRIEARCWAGHPTAPQFLALMGFARDAAMPGFGWDGAQTFLQFSWVAPAARPIPHPAQPPEGDRPCA